jgi:DNA topoisomerase VI subunit B
MNNSGIDDSKRRMLERVRANDYVTLKGLTTLTGSEASRLDLFCMKELADNGLDACSEVEPLLEIVYRTREYLTLTVRDNGHGLSRLHVEKLTDFNKFYSTKYHFKIPARGALGHAFKALMGIPYALAHERNIEYLHPPIRIRTRGKEYDVSLEIDKLNGEVKRRISTGDTDVDGTEISLTLPIFMENWGWLQRYIVLLRGYALVNP